MQINLIRVFSDLDVGTTPAGEATTILNQLEARPANRYMGCSSLVEHINEKHCVNQKIEILDRAVQRFYTLLAELPKITREFYYALLSRSEFVMDRETYGVRLLAMKRLVNISEMRFNEELVLLQAYDLANVLELRDYNEWIMLTGAFDKEPCLVDMMEYIEDKGLDLKKIFVDLDFTCFS